jgi:hypothetical protein
MNIITQLPRYSDGEVNRALIREITTGMELKKQTERKKEIEAAEQAKQYKDVKAMKGLGRCVGVIPEWEFFRMQQKYGHAEIHSKGFMKYFQKAFPHLSPNKL